MSAGPEPQRLARVIDAADAARQEFEAALHDGIQQELVAIVVRLQLAGGLIGSDPDAAAEALAELRADVNAALGRVRALSDRIYPSLLRARGLTETLRAERDVAVRAANVGRYPTEIEATVCFCCRDAIDEAGGPVAIELVDDGAALHFELRSTSGVLERSLDRIRDRVEARGGHVSIEEAGARVCGTIPLPQGSVSAR
jgi:hypothetical protein